MRDFINLGHAAFHRVMDKISDPAPDLTRNPWFSSWGVPIRKCGLFPYTQPCDQCAGSGSGGEESTYCRKCAGQGGTRIEGVMSSGESMTILTSPLPLKFATGWPQDIAVPLRKVSGIRTVAWPSQGR